MVDFDVGLRNLDLVLGVERRIVYDLTDVVQDITKLPQSLISDRRLPTLSLLPASQTRDKDALTEEGVGRVISKLRETFDWVICDSPAGIEHGALCAMRFADAAVIVTNPQVSSISDPTRLSASSIQDEIENGERIEQHLLITHTTSSAPKRRMLTIENLFLPIPSGSFESKEVLRASSVGSPITLNNKTSTAARPIAALETKWRAVRCEYAD